MTLKRGVKTEYNQILLDRFWEYRENRFMNQDHLFDKPLTSKHNRPPVFKKKDASQNVVVESYSYNNHVLNAIKPCQRHRWFGSMKSSQALAQSVFGNLQYHGKLHLLQNIFANNESPFPVNDGFDCTLEHELLYSLQLDGTKRNMLGEQEGRGTSIDAFLSGNLQVAIECKLAEEKIGECSKYKEGNDCYLTSVGVKYWEYIPKLFRWSVPLKCDTCPLRETYQLVRNILAACVPLESEPTPDTVRGHAVLLYDDRNPEFHDCCGKGMKAWQKTKDALKPKFTHLLQKCTWQKLMAELCTDPELKWLTDELNEKYGF